MPDFLPGLELSERFFHEALKPLLEKDFPGLAYGAARLDQGSDVLGFDTPQSMDHDWGPRLTLFLAPADLERERDRIDAALGHGLPSEFLGFPVSFSPNS